MNGETDADFSRVGHLPGATLLKMGWQGFDFLRRNFYPFSQTRQRFDQYADLICANAVIQQLLDNFFRKRRTDQQHEFTAFPSVNRFPRWAGWIFTNAAETKILVSNTALMRLVTCPFPLNGRAFGDRFSADRLKGIAKLLHQLRA